MKKVRLPSGEAVCAVGQGTWHMGENAANRQEELAALRLGMDLGLSLIDTAEMYGEGAAEALVGEAIAGRREEVFLVSKVYPHNATRRGTTAACERSLRRLGTDRIDLADMREAAAVPGGESVASNQCLYNLMRRGIEWDLLPWMREHRIPLMAYSPFEQGRLLRDPRVDAFARRHDQTPAEVALAWLLSRDDVIAIPKTARRGRLKENAAALERSLSAAQLAELDRLFPPPTRQRPLEML